MPFTTVERASPSVSLEPLRTNFKNLNAIAEISIGKTKPVHFLIHRELLTNHSPFFSAALNGTFAEGLSQHVELPEERLDIFEHFIHWVYTQTLDANAFWKDGKPTYFLLLDLYGLADRLSVEALRNCVVDEIAKLAEDTNSVPTPSDTYILYDTIRDNALVRDLVLDLFAFKKTDNLLASHADPWHPMFLRDLCVRLKRTQSTALDRHDFEAFRVKGWDQTRACEVCKNVLRPQVPAGQCRDCHKTFCSACMARGRAVVTGDWPGDSLCKPWKRDMCRYHDHHETDVCRPDERARGRRGMTILR
ncbi:hypothetical protein P152DRAFT_63073 [Eremomyces bilateralis CBS 781.70]|uniref:BTB domain-containing protein n=1 Tax=Eremomyces bilateralis CBS 781.70 TaxID=1392243 RepID=A0A6G1FZ80_9PEZI|nr:uncharacterized protein P152DRAFT_63073 [Eremomyces bilateralis CBS 781.70]KAF1811157.1 hypothetical protein P152DRAFT_63073 [Eremomyces bilateralis CBS 781.70]